MVVNILRLIAIFILTSYSIYSYGDDNLNKQLQDILTQTRHLYGISAISLSISLPNNNNLINVVSGTMTNDGKKTITANNLFQVGSITKTFTSAIILQLETENKLNLNEEIGRWFPQYPNWKNVTIKQLLNQTSGIPDYDNSTNWWNNLAANPTKIWQSDELLDIAYHEKSYFPPGSGWHYSNTNYVLAGVIIEKITGHTVQQEMIKRILNKFNLNNSYYPTTNNSQYAILMPRIVQGYFANNDMTAQNTSWLLSAGALVSTPQDIAHWGRLLYNGKVLNIKQYSEMTSLVSTATGQPTKNLTDSGYGLGLFRINTPYGLMWFTPGLTSGYRSILVFMPCDNIVFAYSVSNSLMDKKAFHQYFISKILNILVNNKSIQDKIQLYQNSSVAPHYCNKIVPANSMIFPKIG